MEKAAIITFLSVKSKVGKTENYYVDGDNQDYVISGVETNDAPVKYLIDKATNDGNKIDRIACIVSEAVYANGDNDSVYNRFQNMVAEYVNDVTQNKQKKCEIQFELIPYDFCFDEGKKIKRIETQSEKALSVYKGIINSLNGYSEVYIDYTGGFRDTSFLTTVLIRYLEFINVTCNDIVYSKYDTKTIYSLSYIYDMFKLLNAVSQFVETGNGKLLHNVYAPVEHEPTRQLVKCIQKFSDAISLCDVNRIDNLVDKMTEAIVAMEKSIAQEKEQQRLDMQVTMFSELLPVIRKKFYMEDVKDEEGSKFTYPKLIKWCVDNNLIQQALTLYVEKMPIVYFQEGLVKQLETSTLKESKGSSKEVDNFYKSLYSDVLKSTDKISEFKRLIRQINEEYALQQKELKQKENSNIKDVIEKFKEGYKDNDEIKKGLERVAAFVEKHYWVNGTHKMKSVNTNQKCSFLGIEINAKSDRAFMNSLEINNDLLYAFVWNDAKKLFDYKKRKKGDGTIAKKILAINAISERTDISKYTEKLTYEKLKDLMLYYLIVKYLRNHINHASENESEDEDMVLIDYCERRELNITMQLENICQIICSGLAITNPELIK